MSQKYSGSVDEEYLGEDQGLPPRKKSERLRLKNTQGGATLADRNQEFVYDWDSNDSEDVGKTWSNGASCAVVERRLNTKSKPRKSKSISSLKTPKTPVRGKSQKCIDSIFGRAIKRNRKILKSNLTDSEWESDSFEDKEVDNQAYLKSNQNMSSVSLVGVESQNRFEE